MKRTPVKYKRYTVYSGFSIIRIRTPGIVKYENVFAQNFIHKQFAWKFFDLQYTYTVLQCGKLRGGVSRTTLGFNHLHVID